MACQNETVSVNGIKYATVFDEKLLGAGCDVEVVVDVETGQSQATVAMRPFLRSSHAFKISVEDLAAMAETIRSANARAKLLNDKIDGAVDHQLNFSAGGSSLIIVHPKDKKARFVLTIGSFSREGELEKISDLEVAQAVKTVEALRAKVVAKVSSFKS